MEVRETSEDRGRLRRFWSHPSWWSLLIVAPWMIGAALQIYQWRVDRAIAQRQQTTWGTVLTHEPHNHNRYGYTFSVNAISYSGWHSPENEEPTVGQRVTVYYDPVDPNSSALDDFGELASRVLGPVPLEIGGSVVIALIIVVRRRMIAMKT